LLQSWRSNYCAVYATAMLLSRLGVKIRRREEAWSLFGLTRTQRHNYAGTSLRKVREIIAEQSGVIAPRWTNYWRLDSRRLISAMVREVALGPTLLSFDGVSLRGVRGSHIVVAVSESGSKVEVMDPLGRQTTGGPNVSIDLRSGKVCGAAYRILVKRGAWLLRYRGRT
jgi:hypothetical protein